MGLLKQNRAHLGEFDVSAGPVEQLGPERVLELADLHAQSRLRDMQTDRRATEVQLLGDRDEVPQHAQLRHLGHVWTLTTGDRKHQ
ncbi:hypothetical protein GCM10025883_39120 [Mobilicoccus caccae]|uniref:Uncharacterized protein n=1 Tax=Mobilicoccus caccae TaxID=1859295 RepID=A0ABQ6IXJ5_9MICO|nr:hypothetical protein GCM10025883_39120 [Mobilicoccus caccae]